MKLAMGMSMLALGLAATGGAMAGPQYGGRGSNAESVLVRCESENGGPQQCDIGSRISHARLAQQRSSAPCIEGRTFGYERGVLWVTGGCRGEFRVYRSAWNGSDSGWGNDGRVFRCESQDNRYRQCDTQSRSRARLVRQLSDAPCIEGRTWGSDRGGVWVDRGCRAEFSAGRGSGWGNGNGSWGDRPGYGNDDGYGQTVRCESIDNRTQQCSANVRRDVRLVRQLSDTRCVEGQNWGWNRGGIWVSRGCRAEFEVR